MNRHWCPCGAGFPTRGGLNRHRPKCSAGYAQLRDEWDRARLQEVQVAGSINRLAKEKP